MKTIVEYLAIKETPENVGTIDDRNKRLSDAAFDWQNFKLKILNSSEPREVEVIIVLYYNQEGGIQWAFKHPENIPDDIKEQYRTILKKYVA